MKQKPKRGKRTESDMIFNKFKEAIVTNYIAGIIMLGEDK